MAIYLGQTAKDQVTGFKGVATGCVQYLTGCNQVLLQPAVGPDGVMRESQWFDVQRLDVDPSVPQIFLDNASAPGFDKPAPRR